MSWGARRKCQAALFLATRVCLRRRSMCRVIDVAV
jgi:hypothetical protein